MKKVFNLAKELQENKTKRKEFHVRSSSFPVENSPKTTKRSFSCGDTVSGRSDFELAGAIPRDKQEDITNEVQDTKV